MVRISRTIFASAAFAIVFGSMSAYSQARTAPVKFRSITVMTEPKASVWIDGVGWGKADETGKKEIKTLSPGVRQLRVRADGFKEKTVPVPATQTGEVKVVLVKTTDEAELAFQEGERMAFSDREKAAEAYRRAVKLRPNYPDAYVALARVLTEAQDPESAMEAILAAKKLRPGFAEASAVEGRIHKENGDEQKAVAAFKRALIEGKGVQPEAHAGLGLYYKEKAEGAGASGDYEAEDTNFAEAAKNMKLSLKQLSGAPDTVVIYQLLGLIYERQKKYKEAIETYEEFLRIFPDNNEATAVKSFIVQIRKAMAENP